MQSDSKSRLQVKAEEHSDSQQLSKNIPRYIVSVVQCNIDLK